MPLLFMTAETAKICEGLGLALTAIILVSCGFSNGVLNKAEQLTAKHTVKR